MSKYLAVIKDSLREALASRVLWIVLIMITLLLLLLAPLSYREDLTWRLGDDDVKDWTALMETVRKESESITPSPAQRMWTLLPKLHQVAVSKLNITGRPGQ